MNRKTLFCFLTALIMIFVLAGCGGKNSGGNIDNVQIPDWKPSEIYSLFLPSVQMPYPAGS